MSDPVVIREMSLTLQTLLKERLNRDGTGLGSTVEVTVDSPHRGKQEEFRVNLFLYNLVQDEGRRNAGGWIGFERGAQFQKFAREPLALRLFYLVTALAGDGLTEHHLLGEAMQALYINRRIPTEKLQGSLKTGRVRAEHVEVNLLNLDIDTLQKIWGSQHEPPRTSVAYQVDTVFLDSSEADAEVQLVQERIVEVLAFPSPTAVAPEAAPVGAVVRLYGAGLMVPQPRTGRNLVRAWFGDAEAELLPGGSAGAVSLRVPATLKPGPAAIKLQLDRYTSQLVAFEVLPG